MKMSKVKKEMNYQLIINIIVLLFGIVLLVFPANGLSFITWIIGIALCGVAVVCGVIFAMNRKDAKISLLIVAAASLIMGILIMVFRLQVATVVLPIIIGIWVIASAVICIMAAIGYKKAGATIWWMPLIAALVALIVAVLIFFNLFGAARLLAYFIAAYCIVFSAIRIGEYFTLSKYLRD